MYAFLSKSFADITMSNSGTMFKVIFRENGVIFIKKIEVYLPTAVDFVGSSIFASFIAVRLINDLLDWIL